jgi:hypothetical protein
VNHPLEIHGRRDIGRGEAELLFKVALLFLIESSRRKKKILPRHAAMLDTGMLLVSS